MKSIKDIGRIRNYYFPITDNGAIASPGGSPTVNLATQQDTSPQAIKRNLTNFITPVQLQRLKVDVAEWRRSQDEAEQAFYPHRVRMQRIYIDTVLNGHVWAAMDRRRDLTLLRKYKFKNKAKEENEELKLMFDGFAWFSDFLTYCLDALAYGYSLISLGDIVDSIMEDVTIVRRWNVSPDREIVSNIVYAVDGARWTNPQYRPWHIYVKTPTEHGVGKCGFGYLYKVALYEIIMRNVLGYNSDFVELYAQPYRVGKTSKTNEDERNDMERALQSMGSNGYAVIDPNDEIEFLETALGGTGWKGYDNLEERCMKMISKIILGHADALDSTPGKLGGGQDGEQSPVAKALSDKQTKDGRFISPIINRELLPRLRDLGFKIPDGWEFVFDNDDELVEQREREDKNNAVTAGIAQTMKNAGMKMDTQYFTERTGIPAEEVEEVEPDEDDLEVGKPGDKPKPGKTGKTGKPGEKPNPDKIKNMMDDLYAKH
jgi:phage gp29-like protein